MADSTIAISGAPLPMRPAPPATDDMRHAAEQFESVFIAEMLAPMFEGLQTDGLGGGGMGEEIFRPMLIERYADALARAGGVGIADSIVAELARMQTSQTGANDGADR